MGVFYKENTEFGKILISEHTISQGIVEEIQKNKNVYVANKMGKKSDKIFITKEDNVVEVKVPVVVKFGTSIQNTTEEILTCVYDVITKFPNIQVKKITVTVVGVVSKKLAKRNIEVSKTYDIL